MSSPIERRKPDHVLVAYMVKLGKERLVEECEQAGPTPDGRSWRGRSSTELAQHLLGALDYEAVEHLAADGKATQRTPPVGGPSWQYGGSDALSVGVARKGLSQLADHLPSDWEQVELDATAVERGLMKLRYTSFSYEAFGARLGSSQAHNSALILLDYPSQVFTIAARTDEDALTIGRAVGAALGSTNPRPFELAVAAELESDVLSTATTAMLEAVYGRCTAVGTVINVDAIWSRRQDQSAQVEEDRSRGNARHVLADRAVIRRLIDGDEIKGVAFMLAWAFDPERQPYVAHVTIRSENGPLILRVTRDGQPIERTCELYHRLRRALVTPLSVEGRERAADEVNRIEEGPA